MTSYYVYILASRRDGAIYVGITRDLVKRVYEHRSKAVSGFTARYNITMLVWFEAYDDPLTAIAREGNQEVASVVEGRSDREDKPELG